MKPPASRQELLCNIHARHRQFRLEIATIPASHFRQAVRLWPEHGLHADAAMVLTDVILWNTMILQFANDLSSGPLASYYRADAMLSRVDHLSSLFQRHFAASSLHELEALTMVGQARIVDSVARHSEASLFDPSVGPIKTLGGKIQCFTCMAYADALSKLRRWKQVM